MYFFNPEDFNCNEIPSTEKWAEYCDTLKTLFDNYVTCFKNWYAAQDKDLLGDSCKSQIAIAYDGWLGRVSSYNNTLNVLIAEIESMFVLTTCDFNRQTYINYIIGYNNMIESSDRISLMTSTGCKLVAFNRHVGVDTTDITGDNKLQRCSGTYIKQIDNGSEFIGSVNITGGVGLNNKSGNGVIIIGE
jgi:hypothetical protein